MQIGTFNTEVRPLIIAEVGNNHEGSAALAEEMIGRAAEAGADAVKFQTFRTEFFVGRANEARYRQLKSYELKPQEWESLAATARRAGLLFISTPLDLDSVDFLEGLVDVFKIASSDNTFFPLMEKVAATGKPLLLSCGLADMEEVVHSSAFIHRAWRDKGNDRELGVLHCVTAYPVPPEEANISAISALRARLPDTIGYSDHTLGIEAVMVATALGAEIIEKHFTLDRNQSDFKDHKISSTPEELKQLVEGVSRIRTLLGQGGKTIQASEQGVVTAVRRSVVAKADLAAGDLLTWERLAWTRPGGGIPPGREASVLGRRLIRPLKAGEWVLPDACEQAGLPEIQGPRSCAE